jgi:hypothetical protein
MRYIIFSGHAGYSADMRNANDSIGLQHRRRSDYRADMRKSNASNDLCRHPFFANVSIAVRARPRVKRCAMERVVGVDPGACRV